MQLVTLENAANSNSFLDQAESFLNQPVFKDTINFPLDLKQMAAEQKNCAEVQQLAIKQGLLLQRAANNGPVLVHKENKIVVPINMRNNLMVWYHDNSQHPGQSWMYSTIK